MGNDQKKCSACGEAQEADAAFCIHCGQRFTKEDSNVKKCPSCGASNKPEDAFCSECGNRLGDKPQTVDTSPIGKQLLAMANDFLSVRETSPGRFEFSSETGTRSPLQKVKIKYEAVAQLEPQTKQLTFWEKMVESSAGMTAGVFAEKSFQKGIDVGKKIHGQILFGGKYGFEYGKLKDVVKAIAGENGWNYKTAIFKPDIGKDKASQDFWKSLLSKKILVPALAILLIAVIGAAGYFYFSSRSTNLLSQTKLKNSDSRNTDTMGSSEGRVFKKEGPVAGGNPFIETDKDTYSYGEKIRVHYYNTSGYPRDWICIVPEGSRSTYAGDYKYISGRGRGVLTFASPQPGRYEARAFYYYIPGRYNISARHDFTVQSR